MKKKKSILFTFVIIIISIITILVMKQNSISTFSKDGITFALLLDGDPITDIPEKGNYTVNVRCTNAKGTWSSEKWNLIIENITGKVICYIDFLTANLIVKDNADSDYLNQKIIDMAVEGTQNGEGQKEGNVVHETFMYADDTTYSTLTYDEYGTITNNTTYPFTWDETNSQWTGNITTSKKAAAIEFYPSKEGYYQMCYNIPPASVVMDSPNSNYLNYIWLYINNNSILHIDSDYPISVTDSTITKTGCIELGYVAKDEPIKVSTRFYNKNSQFYFKVTADEEIVNAGYRYEGKEPNNYIWFNNELWRIIGVFDTCTELDNLGNCIKTEKLTKIVKNTSIGNLGGEEFKNSQFYKLLNYVEGDANSGAYLNSANGTDSGYCKGYGSTYVANCDYRIIGLNGTNSYYGSMIKNVVWKYSNLLSLYENKPVSVWHSFENSNLINDEYYFRINGYVGLLHGSDYGFSVKASDCNRTQSLGANASCIAKSWLNTQGYEFVLYGGATPNNGLENDFSIVANIRPVVYLDSSVYVVNPDEEDLGSITNPFQIALAQ